MCGFELCVAYQHHNNYYAEVECGVSWCVGLFLSFLRIIINHNFVSVETAVTKAENSTTTTMATSDHYSHASSSQSESKVDLHSSISSIAGTYYIKFICSL